MVILITRVLLQMRVCTSNNLSLRPQSFAPNVSCIPQDGRLYLLFELMKQVTAILFFTNNETTLLLAITEVGIQKRKILRKKQENTLSTKKK